MSEAYQQHIFEPFSQESDGVKSKYDGTGLGLPITKRMIELMDGTIDFWSQKNVGTRFTVRLPLEIDIVSCHCDRAIHADETANLAGLRALLVEDNEMNMEIAEFLLKGQHMQVDFGEKDVLVNGRQPLDMRAEVFCPVFDDVNGDGNSTGRGEVECMERLD